MTFGHWSMVLPRADTRQCGGSIHPIWYFVPGVDCFIFVAGCCWEVCAHAMLSHCTQGLTPWGNCQFHEVISPRWHKPDRIMLHLQEKKDNSVGGGCTSHELVILEGWMTWYLSPLVGKLNTVSRVRWRVLVGWPFIRHNQMLSMLSLT